MINSEMPVSNSNLVNRILFERNFTYITFSYINLIQNSWQKKEKLKLVDCRKIKILM